MYAYAYTVCCKCSTLEEVIFRKTIYKSVYLAYFFFFFCVVFITQQVIFPTHFPLISLCCLFTQWLDINTQYKRHKNHKRMKKNTTTTLIRYFKRYEIWNYQYFIQWIDFIALDDNILLKFPILKIVCNAIEYKTKLSEWSAHFCRLSIHFKHNK